MDLPVVSWQFLALQIPLALVIVVLVVYVLIYMERIIKAFLEFNRQQSEMNREFIKSQQESHNQSIARLAEEIKSDKVERIRESTTSRAEIVKEVSELTKRVDSVIDKAIMLERLLPDKSK